MKKKTCIIASLAFLCSVLVFTAQPVFAASVSKTYTYSSDVAAPDPIQLATKVEHLSDYVAENGATDLCYLVMDYGEDWDKANHKSWRGDYEAFGYYYVNYFFVGESAPKNRYLYVYYLDNMLYDGDVLSGVDKYEFSRNAATSPAHMSAQASSTLEISGAPLAAVWCGEDGTITVDQNTFGNPSSSSTSTYSVYMSRLVNATSYYEDTYTFYTLDEYYPVLLGVHDNDYDITQSKLWVFNFPSSSSTKLFYSSNFITTLDNINFTFTFPTPIGEILDSYGVILASVFDFVSDAVVLLCENILILILLCIPLVGLIISVFKKFTGR